MNVFDANLTLYEAFIIKKNAYKARKMLTLHIKCATLNTFHTNLIK